MFSMRVQEGQAMVNPILVAPGDDSGLCSLFDLLVGGRGFVRVEAGLLEDGLVVVEDRRGGVERHGVEVAL